MISWGKDIDVASVIQESSVENLLIFTAGPISSNPSEILSSKHMLELIEDLKQKYDMVILDLAPIHDIIPESPSMG